MRAVMVAAGMGRRLALADGRPKSLLEFGGRTLLARHIAILRAAGLASLDLCIGYRAEAIEAEIARIGAGSFVRTVVNPDYAEGSAISLWHLRDALTAGQSILFMDADVLYDQRMIARLLAALDGDYFLMDRALEPGDEPVKLCLTGGILVDFDKQPERPHDTAGEWIGFARFRPATAARVAAALDRIAAGPNRELPYEKAFRETLLAAAPGAFQVIDVSDLPWIEIDFAEDVRKAESEILPRLRPLPEQARR